MPADPANERRRTFDRAADAYHQARPEYPDIIFDRLLTLLPSDPQIIEVGPGTGQATEPMLNRGGAVRAIEIGPRLATQLAGRLEDFVKTGQLEVVVGDFETINPEPNTADAVVSATAYHWITPAQQLSRPQRWLRPEGRLAVIDTMQVSSPVDGGYFEAVQPIYERHGQASGGPDHHPETVTSPIHDRMVASDTCLDITLDRCRWDQTYSAEEYRALLNTYSGTLAMPEPARTHEHGG